MKRPTLPVVAALVCLAVSTTVAVGQLVYSHGQNVVPVFEGWEQNADGSYTLIFGYFNRNREEIVDVPVGHDNWFEPGDADRGQPTRFYPSRNRYWFRVRVPRDFGSQELVWTLTSNGKTERAYATLNPSYASDNTIRQLDVAGINLWWAEKGVNAAPAVRIQGEAQRRVKVGEPLTLVASAADDGVPPAPEGSPRRGRYAWYGLRVAWFVDRGAGAVTFDPPQFKVYPDEENSPWAPGWAPPPPSPDGRYPVQAVFSTPGDYVVRVMAHDGGLATTADVVIHVE